MVLAKHQFDATNDQGNVLPDVLVEVRRESTNQLVSLYSDRAGTVALGNPFTVVDGKIAFHVTGGSYKLTLSSGAYSRTFNYVKVGLASELDIVGQLEIDAQGNTAGRATHDGEAAGFVYLDTDTSLVYFKNSATSADWSDGVAFGQGSQGEKGDTGTSFQPDKSGNLTGRAAYDGEAENFSYLDIDNALLYIKLSATNDDWSVGLAFGKGDTGDNAYVYLAYASDVAGTGFSLTPSDSLKYIAIKSTSTAIPSPVVGDFAGLWVLFVGGLSSIDEDTNPAFGGNLDVSGFSIVSVSDGNIDIAPNGTGKIVLDGINWPTADGTDGQVLETDGAGQLTWADQSGGGGAGEVSFTDLANVYLILAAEAGAFVVESGWVDEFATADYIDAGLSSNYSHDVTNHWFVPTGGSADDVVPDMASASQDGYIITASSNYSGEVPYLAFDGTTSTFWGSSSSGIPAELRVQLASSDTAAKVAIRSRPGTEFANHSPLDFTIHGSADGSTWDLLHTVSGEAAWAGSERREYTLSAPGSYLHYKALITAAQSGNKVAIAELEFLGSAAVDDMTIVSDTIPAIDDPDQIRIVAQVTAASPITINTDLKAYVSRDDGTNFDLATLVPFIEFGGIYHYQAQVDVSGQPAGSDLRYKLTTHNGFSDKISGAITQGD